jgi:uncharacterized protein YozE (UPF0346 family)
MAKFEGRTCPCARLLAKIRADPTFPKKSVSRQEIHDHLVKTGANPENMDAFANTWAQYTNDI